MAFKLRELGRLQFFQSSLPYLNNNAVTKFLRNHTRHWRSDEPHPSNHRFLSIANGHYGIYFTILNHELRREEKAGLHDSGSHVLLVFPTSSLLPHSLPFFVISKVKDEVYSHINQLKDVSRELLSLWALVRPKNTVQQPCFVRHFTTTARDLEQDHPRVIPLSKPRIEEIVESKEAEEIPFEISFQTTQCDKILQIFTEHASPKDLDIVYPLYQSLKRNSIPLLSIQHYNIVLESILTRSLDNDSASLPDIESRLTKLLTVYQDILHLCSTTSLRPDKTTYDLVLRGIFDGCSQVMDLSGSPSLAHHVQQEFQTKAMEFCQVGINLFLSLKDRQNLALPSILPSLVSAVSCYPQLLTKDLMNVIIELREVEPEHASYYVGMINLSKYLTSLDIADMNKESVYAYLISIFEDYKQLTQTRPEFINKEYLVYSALITALISNGNLSLATKFLDDILVDYKASLQAYAKDIAIAKQKVSSLLSVYLEAIMSSGQSHDLHKAYNLLEKFNSVPYLPELTVPVYSELIARFIGEYSSLEMQKQQLESDQIIRAQKKTYDIIWRLHDKVAIRTDYQNILSGSSELLKFYRSSRETLLSFSIDLSDHSKVLRLAKEIIAKNHIVRDWNVSKKMVLYLVNCSQMLKNDDYLALCWSLLEQQASHHSGSSSLNSFVSEHLPYLTQIMAKTNSDYLVNSPMLEKAFAGFDLASDNIYGLMCAINHLVTLTRVRKLLPNEKFKLLRLHSLLIMQFEDPENHYLQMSDDIEQFKASVKGTFHSLMSSLTPGDNVDAEIIEACKLLGVGFESGDFKISSFATSLDLSHLLSAHFNQGVSQFIEAYRANYNFSPLTWKIIINQNFVNEVLVFDKDVRIKDFVSRLLKLEMEDTEKHALLSNLICINNEKVNIEVLKYLTNFDETGALRSSRVLDGFATFALISDNTYFMSILEASFSKLLMSNDNNRWVYKLVNKLRDCGKQSLALTLVSNRIKSLDLTFKDDMELLSSVLTCLVDKRKDDDVAALMKHHFSGPEGNNLLMQSEKILSILIDFYITRGNYELVLSRFGELADRSPRIQQSLTFAKLMLQIAGRLEGSSQTSVGTDIDSFALNILERKNASQMFELMQLNEQVMSRKALLFDTMVSYLTKASVLSSTDERTIIKHKFEEMIKFCKRIRMRELTSQNLVNVIRLLSAMNAKDLLNILVNKFINRGQTSSVINLYFLNFRVTSTHEVDTLRKEFELALRKVGDQINLMTLQESTSATMQMN